MNLILIKFLDQQFSVWLADPWKIPDTLLGDSVRPNYFNINLKTLFFYCVDICTGHTKAVGAKTVSLSINKRVAPVLAVIAFFTVTGYSFLKTLKNVLDEVVKKD